MTAVVRVGVEESETAPAPVKNKILIIFSAFGLPAEKAPVLPVIQNILHPPGCP